MRVLHLADWHLGRRTLRESRAADHDAVIAEILDIARDARPDLIVHAGDLWDSARPGHDDLLRGVEALRDLAGLCPVHVVCGNHDSPSLFRALGRLPGVAEHVSFAASDDDPLRTVPLRDGGRALVASIPYPHPNRSGGPDDQAAAYRADLARRLGGAAERLAREASPGDRRILAAHIHVAGAQLSNAAADPGRAESLSADPDALPRLDYVALGHIHRPQPIGDRGRYAGSPVPLDFSEAGDRKSVALVTAMPGDVPRVETVPLAAGRPLITVQGGIDELARRAPETVGALCRAIVTGEEPAAALADRVRDALPEARVVEVVASRPERGADDHEPGPNEGAAPLSELLRDYLVADGVSGPRLDRLLGRFEDLAEAARHERDYEPDELVELGGGDEGPGERSATDETAPPSRPTAGTTP